MAVYLMLCKQRDSQLLTKKIFTLNMNKWMALQNGKTKPNHNKQNIQIKMRFYVLSTGFFFLSSKSISNCSTKMGREKKKKLQKSDRPTKGVHVKCVDGLHRNVVQNPQVLNLISSYWMQHNYNRQMNANTNRERACARTRENWPSVSISLQ